AVADLMAKLTQPGSQLAQALRRPQQRSLGIAARRRLDQTAQIIQQRRILGHKRLAATTGPPHAITIYRLAAAQLDKSASNRAARHASALGNRQDPAMPRSQRLRRRKPATPALIKKRLK